MIAKLYVLIKCCYCSCRCRYWCCKALRRVGRRMGKVIATKSWCHAATPCYHHAAIKKFAFEEYIIIKIRSQITSCNGCSCTLSFFSGHWRHSRRSCCCCWVQNGSSRRRCWCCRIEFFQRMGNKLDVKMTLEENCKVHTRLAGAAARRRWWHTDCVAKDHWCRLRLLYNWRWGWMI